MTGLSQQQLLILAVLLFLSVLILGCLCLLTTSLQGGPAFIL